MGIFPDKEGKNTLENYFIKGLLIALIFGVPAGVIGALTIQRTLERGFLTGLFTGLGSTAADLLYACVGLFGMTIVSDFLTANQTWIRIVGSILIFLFGLQILRKKEKPEKRTDAKQGNLVACFFSSFLIAIMNPATIMSFLIVFATFGIQEISTWTQGGLVLGGIAAGTTLWWLAISAIVTIFRNRMTETSYQRLNKLLGFVMIVFACIMLLQAK